MRSIGAKTIFQRPILFYPFFTGYWRRVFESAKPVVWNLFLISSGSVVCAVGINGILVPNDYLSGGLMGLAMTLNRLLPDIPLTMLLIALNTPVFVIGWIYVGRHFFFYSLVGMIIFSTAIGLVDINIPVTDKILCAVLAGIITGLGCGIILESVGSAGGMDIISIILLKRFNIRLGTSILASNAVILVLASYFFSLDSALYTLVYLYVSTKALNVVVYGLSQRKSVYVISEKWEQIHHEILENVQRGVTILEGRGGYTGNTVRILLTVISFQELPRLKRLISSIDPDAFVVVSDTLEVMGKRIGNQPHW